MLITVLSAVLALALVAIGGALIVRPAIAQSGDAVPARRHITVVGHGEAEGRPDTASVQIGVTTEAATAQEALAQNNAQAQAIHASLKELGIEPKDIRTSNFSIFPLYDKEGHKVTDYRVSNTVTVTIHNLDQAGMVLDQVVQVGANRINGISFRVSDLAALQEQTRASAMQNAQAKAAQLAQAADAALGEVLVITENVGNQPPVPLMTETAGKGGGVPIEPGQQQISVAVQVTYGLKA
jgi:uncharacterized protein YggE